MLGMIAVISRPLEPIMARALADRGSNISVYLGQTILLSSIFSAYGGFWREEGCVTRGSTHDLSDRGRECLANLVRKVMYLAIHS